MSILSSWYQYKTNSNGLKIPVTYIFVQTVGASPMRRRTHIDVITPTPTLQMFYEELPAERRAVKRLFQILCDKVRQELQVSMRLVPFIQYTQFTPI